MKKFVIAIAVLGLFVFYSLFVRGQNATIAMPSSLAAGTTSGRNTTTANTSSGSGATSTTAATGTTNAQYKDGNYTGSVADAFYGNVQVEATIAGGRITDVTFLQYPNTHQSSVFINQQAMPLLRQEAIQVQSAHVQIVSGATYTSQAFQQSLQAALAQA